MVEVWKPIAGYEGLYEVSNTGRVRKLRFINNRANKEKVFDIKPKNNGTGYLKVFLYKGGKARQMLVHRLVADAFLDKQDGKGFVNHKDGNKHNNNADNLEWCTRSENMKHAYMKGLAHAQAKGKYGKDNPKAIPVSMFSKDGKLLATFGSLIDAAMFIGAKSSGQICSCCKGRLKTAHGYVWRYANG